MSANADMEGKEEIRNEKLCRLYHRCDMQIVSD